MRSLFLSLLLVYGRKKVSFRTIVVTEQARLSYKNRFLVVKKGFEESFIHLSEIDTIIVDSISVSISTYLLKELSDNKINIIFCDDKHNPFGELQSFYSRYNSSKKIVFQTKWSKKDKGKLWSLIVRNKILNQALVLQKIKNVNYSVLMEYMDNVCDDDKTNREGHASKVYFNSLFGKNFVRNDNDDINSALNYGYAILLSTVNKEIVNNGFITQLGIHHKNEYNPYNLACDLMEVFRPIIDSFVYFNSNRNFDMSFKLELIDLFNKSYKFNNKNYVLKDIIRFYVKNVFDYMITGKEYKDFVYYEG